MPLNVLLVRSNSNLLDLYWSAKHTSVVSSKHSVTLLLMSMKKGLSWGVGRGKITWSWNRIPFWHSRKNSWEDQLLVQTASCLVLSFLQFPAQGFSLAPLSKPKWDWKRPYWVISKGLTPSPPLEWCESSSIMSQAMASFSPVCFKIFPLLPGFSWTPGTVINLMDKTFYAKLWFLTPGVFFFQLLPAFTCFYQLPEHTALGITSWIIFTLSLPETSTPRVNPVGSRGQYMDPSSARGTAGCCLGFIWVMLVPQPHKNSPKETFCC